MGSKNQEKKKKRNEMIWKRKMRRRTEEREKKLEKVAGQAAEAWGLCRQMGGGESLGAD